MLKMTETWSRGELDSVHSIKFRRRGMGAFGCDHLGILVRQLRKVALKKKNMSETPGVSSSDRNFLFFLSLSLFLLSSLRRIKIVKYYIRCLKTGVFFFWIGISFTS